VKLASTALAALLAITPAARGQQPDAPAQPAAAAASPVQVTAQPATTEPALAAPFVVTVEIVGPPGSRFTVPRAGGDGNLELVLEDPVPPGPADAPLEIAGPKATLRFRAQAFAVDEAAVPPIPVRFRLADGTSGETASAPVPLRIASVLPKDPQQRQLADLKGPVGLEIAPAFWWALGAAVLVTMALAWWAWRRWRRPQASAAEPAIPALAPDAEALAALDRLVPFAEAEEHQPFYVGLAAVVKRYLERRLGAPVLEMTSAETLAFLRGHAHGEPLLGPVRELVAAADQVKFARAGSLREEAQRHLGTARNVVAALEARLAPPPAAQEPAA
jgi:hypothetical protein